MNLKWLGPILVVILIAAAVAYIYPPRLRSIPEVLHGRWITYESRYKNCYINLDENYVEIGTSTGASISGGVTAVTRKSQKDHVKYVVTYQDTRGVESILSLRHTPAAVGTLHLENQKNVPWLKMNDIDAIR